MEGREFAALPTRTQQSLPRFLVLYATETGTAKSLVEQMSKTYQLPADSILDISEFSFDSLPDRRTYSHERIQTTVIIFVIPSCGEGSAPKSAQKFFCWLSDNASDPRAGAAFLNGVYFTVFGLCDSTFGRDFYNKAARDLDHWMYKLGAKRFWRVGRGDAKLGREHQENEFATWSQKAISSMKTLYSAILAEKTLETTENDEKNEDDIEEAVSEPKDGGPMVSSGMRAQLVKEGYRVVGTHSAVKQCRWAKNALRGRGFCYKNTFYGILSHRCMEFTCSLACANKCVFCWRHHNNPVSTTWKWQIDDPREIVEEALKANYGLVVPFKGNDLVTPTLFSEASEPIHCALSLVGEPVMYPRVNELIDCLHARKISTFMVTNAQMPDMIEKLVPVTQLYVSVDAAQKDSLEKIDRPLFPNAWERLLQSMDIIREKRHERTVCRLTVVKDWNMGDTAQRYAELLKRGMPDFIEVKGATYCGGKENPLTLKNIPYHDEVLRFARELTDLMSDYSIAAEHAHSCCVLIANKRFSRETINKETGKKEQSWNIWISFEAFFSLEEKARKAETSPRVIRALDYSTACPDWAVFGVEGRGMNPSQKKVPKRKEKTDEKQKPEKREGHNETDDGEQIKRSKIE